MSETRFTPGPWTVPIWGTGHNLEDLKALGLKPVPALSNDGGRYVMAESGRVALVDCQTDYKRGKGHETECAERDANAHLIAAAPDLYDALKLLMTCFPAAIMSLSDEQQQQIRAALAKATP